MGMPCQVNSILKLSSAQGYPAQLDPETIYPAQKQGYRIFPIDVPIPLVDDDWMAHADITIVKLTWHENRTILEFRIARIYGSPFPMKGSA